ncbi:Rgg family transcriptional regulator [Streptococcus suis]
MRWDFGTVLKEIRRSKGLTQAQVCGDFLARPTLSKIENNKEIPSVENMDYLLRQLNMTYGEFDYICHAYQPSERSIIWNDFENFRSLNKNSGVENLLARCEAYLAKYPDTPIEKLVQLLRLCISILETGEGEESKELAMVLWEYLEKADTWYLFDLRLLSTVILLFPIDTLKAITDKLLASLDKYRHFKDVRANQFALLANLSTLFIRNQCREEGLRVTRLAYEIAQESMRFDQLGFATVRMGILQQDKGMVKKGLNILRATEIEEMDVLAMRLERDVDAHWDKFRGLAE